MKSAIKKSNSNTNNLKLRHNLRSSDFFSTNNTIKMKSSVKEIESDDTLELTYITCPTEKRFLVLNTLIKKNCTRKMIIIFNSGSAVEFYHELMNNFGCSTICIHEKQSSDEQNSIFTNFSTMDSGVLLSTEAVIRTWQSIPASDMVVQYDPPHNLNVYLRRLRATPTPTPTPRGARKGDAFLFLTQEELPFLAALEERRVTARSLPVTWSNVANVERKVEKMVSEQYAIYLLAKQAYSGFLKAYKRNKMKSVFDVSKLDYAKVAKCFGFPSPLFVDLHAPSPAAVAAAAARAAAKKRRHTGPMVMHAMVLKPKVRPMQKRDPNQERGRTQEQYRQIGLLRKKGIKIKIRTNRGGIKRRPKTSPAPASRTTH